MFECSITERSELRSDSLLSEPVDLLLEALVLWVFVVLVVTADVVRTRVPGVGGL